MSRFLLLMVFMAWMSWSSQSPADGEATRDLTLPMMFMGGFAMLVLAAVVFNRRLSGQVDSTNLHRSMKRFNSLMSAARMAVPIWFFAGVYFMGWGTLVEAHLRRLGLRPDRYDTPGLLAGCLPAVGAWLGLLWAQYPADICFREQGLLSQLDAGYPVHRPPPLLSYLRLNIRLQLLFTMGPVLALVLMRDLLSLGLSPLGLNEESSLTLQTALSLATAAIVMLFAPELLRRLLQTEPMPDGPLRKRLEDICRRHHIRYRDVLLWRTDYNMGNAAVMGMIPRVRYILMSDLLLETMTDEQIEAVFAHEVGHIIHRHMLWFAVFFASMMFALVGLSGPADALAQRWLPQAEWPAALATVLATGGCFTIFLYLSRKFERQADVFAARTIQQESPADDAGQHVGTHGAEVFASALSQVARINCIPVTAGSWCHGSIAHRMEYLRDLSLDANRTAAFDRFMARLYAVLILALCAFGIWAMVTVAGEGGMTR